MCRSVPTPGLANVLGAAVLGTAVLGAPVVVPAPAGATIGASVTPTSTTPTAGPSGTAGRSPAERRRDEALPRWLLWSMAGLAFLGVLVGFGSASHTLRPRDEHYDRFIG